MKRLAVLAVVCGCALAGPGRAGPITYTEQFTASGSLGSQTFSNATVTITGTGDTANAFTTPGIGAFNQLSAATVTVSGIGSATFVDTIEAGAQTSFQPALAGFSDGGYDVILTSNDAFASYDMTTAITSTSGAAVGTTGQAYDTDHGSLPFTSFGATSSFEATLGTPTAAPEPASLTHLAVGAAGLLGYGWRRQRSRRED
jgi:hypothetical protein